MRPIHPDDIVLSLACGRKLDFHAKMSLFALISVAIGLMQSLDPSHVLVKYLNKGVVGALEW